MHKVGVVVCGEVSGVEGGGWAERVEREREQHGGWAERVERAQLHVTLLG